LKNSMCLCGAVVVLASHGFLLADVIGIDNHPGSGPAEVWRVDPLTGMTTPVGAIVQWTSAYIPVASAGPGAFFALSPVNLYRYSFYADTNTPYYCVETVCPYIGDYADVFGSYYALGRLGNGQPQSLFRMTDTIQGGLHYEHFDYIGPLQLPLQAPDLSIIEWDPAVGLYGTDGTSMGYLISLTTGHATPLAPLQALIPGPAFFITGLAPDSDPRFLIASSASYPMPGFTLISRLDPLTGFATPLNISPLNLVGLADIEMPEPAVAWTLAGGIALMMALRRR